MNERYEPRCVICGELITNPDEMAEMYDRAKSEDPQLWSEAESGIVHVQCGLNKGWEVA